MTNIASLIANAEPGMRIALPPGNYPAFSVKSKALGGVTVAAADPANPPVVAGFNLNAVSGLVLDGLALKYTAAKGAGAATKPFAVIGGSDIAVRDCRFDGDLVSGTNTGADGFPGGYGIHGLGVSRLTVERCRLRLFYVGSVFLNCDEIAFLDNEVSEVRKDGTDIISAAGARIEGNLWHSFRRNWSSGDHCDMLQFWLNDDSKRPTTDVVIARNRFLSGDGWSQSLFAGNKQAGAGRTDLWYRNWLIEENTISNAQTNGITVDFVDGIVIRNNTLMQNNKPQLGPNPSKFPSPTIGVNAPSRNVRVTGNVAPGFRTMQPGWASGNLIVQTVNPKAADYFGRHFVNPAAIDDGSIDIRDYAVIPGGEIDANGLGSILTRPRPAPPPPPPDPLPDPDPGPEPDPEPNPDPDPDPDPEPPDLPPDLPPDPDDPDPPDPILDLAEEIVEAAEKIRHLGKRIKAMRGVG